MGTEMGETHLDPTTEPARPSEPIKLSGEVPWASSAIPTPGEAARRVADAKDVHEAEMALADIKAHESIVNSGLPQAEIDRMLGEQTANEPMDGTTPDRYASQRGHSKGKLAIVMGAVSAVAVAACTRLGIPFPLGAPSQPPTEAPSAIVGESNSPVPIPYSSENPTATAPATSPSKAPEATPTLSPAEELKKTFEYWLDPNNPLPDNDRFYLFNQSKTPAIANALAQDDHLETDYTQPIVEVSYEGFLIDEQVVKASNNKNYLVAYMLQESAKNKDGVNERYIIPVNLGDYNSTDKDLLITGAGIVTSNPSTLAKQTIIPVSDMEQQVKQFNKKFVVFSADVINNAPETYRTKDYMNSQNTVAKAFIEYSKQTLLKPYGQVPQDDLIKNIINKPVKDGFDVKGLPMDLRITVQ